MVNCGTRTAFYFYRVLSTWFQVMKRILFDIIVDLGLNWPSTINQYTLYTPLLNVDFSSFPLDAKIVSFTGDIFRTLTSLYPDIRYFITFTLNCLDFEFLWFLNCFGWSLGYFFVWWWNTVCVAVVWWVTDRMNVVLGWSIRCIVVMIIVYDCLFKASCILETSNS